MASEGHQCHWSYATLKQGAWHASDPTVVRAFFEYFKATSSHHSILILVQFGVDLYNKTHVHVFGGFKKKPRPRSSCIPYISLTSVVVKSIYLCIFAYAEHQGWKTLVCSFRSIKCRRWGFMSTNWHTGGFTFGQVPDSNFSVIWLTFVLRTSGVDPNSAVRIVST